MAITEIKNKKKNKTTTKKNKTGAVMVESSGIFMFVEDLNITL